MRRRFMTRSQTEKWSLLYIEALEDGVSFLFGYGLQYKIDNGEWCSLDAGSISEPINKGSRFYIKGNYRRDTESYSFSINGLCNIGGDIKSLSYGEDAKNIGTINYSSQYAKLFYGCSSIKDASALQLNALLLGHDCYYGMFQDCTGLTQAPELQATTLVNNCYGHMFSGCTGLTQAPELPATTLADSCYFSMFQDCTGLTQAPELPATTLADSCYFSMFQGCTGLTQAPELPATTLADSCYFSMFQGCTGLTQAPELPATALANYCYRKMFEGCICLSYIKMLATDISAGYCLQHWVYSVSPTGTFVKNKDATWDTTPGALGTSGVPAGWTVVNDGEEGGGDNDFGIEFPLYLTFDYCEETWGGKYCYINSNETCIKLFNGINNVMLQYGLMDESGKGTISEQMLNMLGAEIYIENNKVVEVERFEYDSGLIEITLCEEDGSYSMLFSNGEIQKDL